jgi:type IV pilus assembly protein PilO
MKQYVIEILRQKLRLLAVILFLVLLNGALGGVVAMYQLPLLAEMQTRWSDLRNQSRRGGQVDPASLYKQGTADLEQLKQRIPAKREFARVLSDVIESAAASAVEVGTISYKPAQLKDEPLLAYQITLTATGNYAAVKSFLSDLQQNRELLVVDAVSFSNNDPYEEKVAMNLNITVYFREGA